MKYSVIAIALLGSMLCISAANAQNVGHHEENRHHVNRERIAHDRREVAEARRDVARERHLLAEARQNGANHRQIERLRRAVEEGLLQCDKVWQIGLRGSGYSAEDFDWPRQQGFTVVQAHEVWYQSLAPLMQRVREAIGTAPCYLSFDIDGIDPSFAGGTGTPEVGGLTVPQALEIIRGCRGLNLVGGDLVEVSPPYDTSGNTALLGANLLYEMLCVLPGVAYR